MHQLIENLSAQPIVCITLSVFIFLFASLINYLLLDSLLKMHRSKSALKKLKKEYTLLQRLRFLHFKANCRHAAKFCNGMIIYQRFGWFCLALYLFMALLFAFGFIPASINSRLSVAIFLFFDFPSFAINWALSRPLLGRFKEHSFEKYHNTSNHQSLF